MHRNNRHDRYGRAFRYGYGAYRAANAAYNAYNYGQAAYGGARELYRLGGVMRNRRAVVARRPKRPIAGGGIVNRNTAERKRKVLAIDTTLGTAWVTHNCFELEQGLASDERIGNAVNAIGVKIRFYIKPGTYGQVKMRFAVIVPKTGTGFPDMGTGLQQALDTRLVTVMRDRILTCVQQETGDITYKAAPHFSVFETYVKFPHRIEYDYETTVPITAAPIVGYIQPADTSYGSGATDAQVKVEYTEYYTDP